ncbi:MAG: EpsG family protein [Chitinophagaceae bacterium]
MLLPIGLFFYFYRNRFWKLSLSLFFGWISFLFTPSETYDIYRHYEHYDLLSDDFDFFFNYYFLTQQSDFLLPLLMFIGKSITLSHKLFFSAVSFFNFYLIFFFFELCTKISNYPTVRRISYLVVLLLSISYISIYSGVRFYLALSFFLFQVYFFYIKKYKISFIFFALSIFTHFSFLFFGLIPWGVKIFRGSWFIKMIALLVLFLTISLLQLIFTEWSLISYIKDGYLDSQVLNKRVFAWYFFSYSFFIPCFFIFIFYRKTVDYHLRYLIILFFIILLISLSNYVLFDRVVMIFLLLFFFFLISSDIPLKYLFTYIIFLFPRIIADIYDNFEVYNASLGFLKLFNPLF